MAIQSQGLLIFSVKDVEPSHPTNSTARIVISMCFIFYSSGGVSWFSAKRVDLDIPRSG